MSETKPKTVLKLSGEFRTIPLDRYREQDLLQDVVTALELAEGRLEAETPEWIRAQISTAIARGKAQRT